MKSGRYAFCNPIRRVPEIPEQYEDFRQPWSRKGASTLDSWVRVWRGCWVVVIITFSGFVLHFDSAPVGFLLLLDAVSVAILCGFWQATIVSILACGCLDYFFYQPLLTFTISDPRDWVALGAFEISALVVSRVSSREQRSTREATLQRTSMEQLYELSRSTLLINLHQPPDRN